MTFGLVFLWVTVQEHCGTAVNDNSYLFYLASAANAEVLICKASSDWLKLCLLLSFCYLKLQYKLLTASILEWNGVS